VAVVVETKSKKYKVGDRVWLPFNPLVEYSAHRDDGKDNPGGMAPTKLLPFVRAESQLSVLSPAAGVTAYCARNHPCGRAVEGGIKSCLAGLAGLFGLRKEKAVLVTSAAGAVGVVAGQLYKNQGCRVIGVTSSKEKANRLVEEIGYDAAVAYKSEDLDARLGELAPQGFDVFLDNVGAQQLDVGTKHMKVGGKILSVGCMSEVDNFATGDIVGFKQYHRVPARELTFGGFLMYNHIAEVPGAMLSLGMMLWRGKVKSVETLVHGSFGKWAECVDRVYDSETFGRLILLNDEVANKAIGA
jgi:NADPH-dependent curcumin reductase CurA